MQEIIILTEETITGALIEDDCGNIEYLTVDELLENYNVEGMEEFIDLEVEVDYDAEDVEEFLEDEDEWDEFFDLFEDDEDYEDCDCEDEDEDYYY